ncbi:c2h2 type zinc finger domain, partial [Fusarium agapanthi]
MSDSSTRTSVDSGDSYILPPNAQESAEVPPSIIGNANFIVGDKDGDGLIMGDGNIDVAFAFPKSPMSLDYSGPLELCSDIQHMDHIVDVTLNDTTEWLKNASFHAEFDASFLLPIPFIDFSGCYEGRLMQDSTELTATSSESLPPEDKTVFDEAITAYITTLGSWKPTHEDYLAAARNSLYVPLDEQRRLREGLGHLNPAVIDGCLSSARRDEIIVAMIDGAQTAHSLLAVRLFPSAEMLDKLLKVFLTSQETNTSAFIHIATFDPSTCNLSLLISCIVAGAALSSNPTARKFGLGLLDVLRLHLAATMLRHAGRFNQHMYFNTSLMSDGPGSELDKTWRKWAQQESWKRTVFRHLLQCTQRSVIRNMPAQISPLEVFTPIPEDCRFWFAKSAAEWKSLYLDQLRSEESRMTIADCLSDIRSIDLLPSSQAFELSKLLMLYSFLSLLVEDRRRSVFFHRKRDSGWSFTDITQSPGDSHLVSSFSELRYVVERDPDAAGSAILTFMVEFNILYSATPRYLRDSLLTNGKQGSTSEVFSQLQEWQQSRSSRRNVSDTAGTHKQAANSPQVLLDGPESLESQRWISHNNGVPYLTTPSETNGLRDTIPELVL